MKDKFKSLIAFLCFWFGIDYAFYFLNRNAKRIVTFHNVLPDELCACVPHVGVSDSLSVFVRTIDEIAKKFSFSTDLDNPRTVTITFDDGTKNEYEVAGRALMERGIPAILFVTGDIVGVKGTNMPVIEQVCVWSQLVPWDIVQAKFSSVATRGQLWMKVVQPGFRADAENRGRAFLERLNSIYPMEKILATLPDEWNRLRMSGVTDADIEDLREHGWLIGWHTKTHFPLGYLSLQDREVELSCPDEMKKVVLGYPYGDVDSVGKETPDIARKVGYPAAVSNASAYTPLFGRYFMPRMAVSADKYDVHFQLSGMKYFLQHFRLLPLCVN